jgi:hypothetical protein
MSGCVRFDYVSVTGVRATHLAGVVEVLAHLPREVRETVERDELLGQRLGRLPSPNLEDRLDVFCDLGH